MRRSQLKLAACIAAFIGVSASAFAQTGTIYKPVWSFSSGTSANAQVVCTLPALAAPPAGASAPAWIVTGFEITGGGATTGSVVAATLTNMQGGGTVTFDVAVPTGVTANANTIINFPGGLLSTPGASVVLTVPAFGAGSTGQACTLHGVPAP